MLAEASCRRSSPRKMSTRCGKRGAYELQRPFRGRKLRSLLQPGQRRWTVLTQRSPDDTCRVPNPGFHRVLNLTCSLCARLLQPEPHVHLAVHRRCGGQVLLGLFLLARSPEQLAEAEVAVGGEGAHAEVGGECQGLAVRVLG